MRFLVAALVLPLVVPAVLAEPLPPLCVDKTAAAAPYPPANGWARPATNHVDVYGETNGVAGLQVESCLTTDGAVAPADAFRNRTDLRTCVPVVGICVL